MTLRTCPPGNCNVRHRPSSAADRGEAPIVACTVRTGQLEPDALGRPTVARKRTGAGGPRCSQGAGRQEHPPIGRLGATLQPFAKVDDGLWRTCSGMDPSTATARAVRVTATAVESAGYELRTYGKTWGMWRRGRRTSGQSGIRWRRRGRQT